MTNSDPSQTARQPPANQQNVGQGRSYEQPVPPSPQKDNGIDLRELFIILRRRKTLILSILTVSLILMILALSFVQPSYTAKGMIRIMSPVKYSVKEIEPVLVTSDLNTTMILSEVEVLRSRSIARKVIERHGLAKDPELNPLISHPPPSSQTLSMADSMTEQKSPSRFKSLSLTTDKSRLGTPEVNDRLMGRIVNNFLGRVKIKPIAGSSVIRVEYVSTDPEKAASVANALFDTYLNHRLEAKIENTLKVTEWLEERLATLREHVMNSDAAIIDYKAENNLDPGERAEVTAGQLSELNSKLMVARAEKAEAKMRFKQAHNAFINPSKIQASQKVLNSTLISQLKMEELALARRLAALSHRYGPRYPKILDTKKELVKIRETLKEEVALVVESIKNEVKIAEARIARYQKQRNELENTKEKEDFDRIKLGMLEREAETNKFIYHTFLNTYKRASQKEQLQAPEAKIISYATVPAHPSFPNKPFILTLTGALAIFFGLGASLVVEKLDNAFRSAGRLESATGKKCFGLIPVLQKLKDHEIADFILSKPASGLAESIRTLRTVLKLRGGHSGEKPKVITVTSSFPGEGKTTLSCWLARVAAKSGEKVVLVDGDLRRPNIHNMIGGRGDKTIVDYLTGQAKLEEIIKKDTATGLHLIHTRSVPNSALDLVDSSRMRNLIKSLRQAYDLVIVDTPACLAVSDARVLALDSDQILYCVYWDNTPRDVVLSGIKQFDEINLAYIACVLTNVDGAKHARYGYGDTAYYYGKYKEYY